MINDSNFLTEFLAEVNFVLAQTDNGNKLNDLIAPIRNLLMEEKDLLCFSLSRYSGANSRVAFFCEWYFQTLKITNDTTLLFEENRKYFRKKVSVKYRGIPNIDQLIDQDIALFIPHQVAILHTKSKEILDSLVQKYPYLSRYLNDSFISQFYASQYLARKKKYVERVTIHEYLEAQSTNTSFIQIALPCLLGFCFSFNQEESTINPAAVKWIIIEELLKNISLLHQINQNQEFEEFVHSNSLSEREQFEWLQMDPKNRFQRILASAETRETVKSQKEKIYAQTISSIESVQLPDKNKEMLRELLDWVSQIG
jgi:hypothetical protein